FYHRLGFVENPYDYRHPSYCRPFEPHRLVLLSRPRRLENDEARRLADFVREEVLRYSDHGEAPGPRL
ncbi:MAG: N-acetyltransferase, partial [Alistipes sp.]|nr:N-acetyltransferase [Alistipes sp.]